MIDEDIEYRTDQMYGTIRRFLKEDTNHDEVKMLIKQIISSSNKDGWYARDSKDTPR